MKEDTKLKVLTPIHIWCISDQMMKEDTKLKVLTPYFVIDAFEPA